mmetsp:Transcript_2774/g.9782  ORF Transcript_2774/g.9782 Transcript_2774/m.9782 type:complete len:392 (-) Transcript_2774:343-1518(-)
MAALGARVLLFPGDLLVQLLAVVRKRVLGVVVDVDLDDARARGLVVHVVELRDVRVAERLVRRDALVGVELQAQAQQVEGLGRRRREHLRQRARPRRRQRFKHRRRERRLDRGHVVRRRAARHLEDAVQLVHRRVTREDRLASQHLAQNASERPHVDTLAVPRRAKQDLRRAVPARRHVVGELHRGRVADGAREAEVAELERVVGVDQQVLWLDVSMHDVVPVAPFDGAAQLEDVPPHKLGHEPVLVLLQHLQQVLLDVLEDEVQLAFPPERFLQTHDVGLPQHAQDLHLAQRRLAHDLVVLRLLELLDREDLARLLVAALEHDAVRPLPHDAHHLILVHGDSPAAAPGARPAPPGPPSPLTQRAHACPAVSKTAGSPGAPAQPTQPQRRW